jgi:periplasmic protein TonB
MLASFRTFAILLSLVAHASLAFAIVWRPSQSPIDAFNSGAGEDVVTVEQGVALDGMAKLGDALETLETQEVTPVVATPPPPEEVKPLDELRDVVASEESTVIEEVVEAKEPPEKEQEKVPEIKAQEQQPEQVAIATEQSSGEAKTAGNAKAFGLYLGQINDRVQKAKVNPRARLAGTVVMRFTVGVDGQLLSKEIAQSSGSQLLDQAAVTALERAAPFPPIPSDVSSKPLAFTQPFKFILR